MASTCSPDNYRKWLNFLKPISQSSKEIDSPEDQDRQSLKELNFAFYDYCLSTNLSKKLNASAHNSELIPTTPLINAKYNLKEVNQSLPTSPHLDQKTSTSDAVTILTDSEQINQQEPSQISTELEATKPSTNTLPFQNFASSDSEASNSASDTSHTLYQDFLNSLCLDADEYEDVKSFSYDSNDESDTPSNTSSKQLEDFLKSEWSDTDEYEDDDDDKSFSYDSNDESDTISNTSSKLLEDADEYKDEYSESPPHKVMKLEQEERYSPDMGSHKNPIDLTEDQSLGSVIVNTEDHAQDQANKVEPLDKRFFCDEENINQLKEEGHRFVVRKKPTSTKKQSAKTKVDLIDKSSSNWTLTDFSNEFQFSETEELNISSYNEGSDVNIDSTIEEVKSITQVMNKRSNDIEDTSKDVMTDLNKFPSKESDSRMIINCILMKICKELGITMVTEENINANVLPTSRYDYRLYHNGICIGAVEAKGKSMNSLSFVQAVLQLTLIQHEYTAYLTSKEAEPKKIAGVPFFNILTNGYHYIIITLKGTKLQVEHDKMKIRLRRARTWEDLKNIITDIVACVRQTKKLLHID